MSLYQIFSILRARRFLAGTIFLAIVGVALVWIVLRPKNYTAVAPVLVDMRSDPVPGGSGLQGMMSPSFMATQIDIVRSERVAQRAVQALHLDQQPEQLSNWRDATGGKLPAVPWIANELQKKLDVKPARESHIINITWTGRSRAEAAKVANAFAQAYLDVSLELKTDPARGYAAWFEDQVGTARQKLEVAQNRLTDYQQKAGIVSTDERTDYETAHLNELSAQLTAAQGHAAVTPSAAEGSNPIVNNLRMDVAKLESKIHQSAASLGERHPEMQKMQAELSSLRSMLSSETTRAGSSAESSRQSRLAHEKELRDAVEAQKAKVLALSKQRGQLNLLQRDVEAAQKAYDAVTASASQVRLQSMSNQTNVMPLAAAVEPIDAAGLTGKVMLLIAIVAGALLALAGALLAELLNRRVRTVDDLTLVTRLPVLASVPPAANSAFANAYVALPLSNSRRLALAPRRSLA
jgi:polysaccharide biosynthesis transport protein